MTLKNKNVGLLKFQSGYRKFYLNSPKGYSQIIFNMKTGNKSTEKLHHVTALTVEKWRKTDAEIAVFGN